MPAPAPASRRTRPRPTSDPAVRRQDVDGVPVFSGRTSGPLRAGLVFRVGQADERFQQRGVTHLVEHLALSRAGLPPHAFNGCTGRTFTSFYVAGTPAEVSEHLRELCAALADLPTDRLDHERDILRAEAADRGRPLLPLWRWGPQGHGLIAYDEVGLDALDDRAVQEWARSSFHKGNAALWLSGPVPRGLELPLPSSAGLSPVADPAASVIALPAWYPEGRSTDFSYLARRTAAGSVSGPVLARRLEQRLRHELGLVYGVSSHVDRLSADFAEHTFVIGGAREREVEVAERTFEVLLALRGAPVSDEELSDVLQALDLTDVDEPGALAARLEGRVQAHLLGMAEPDAPEEYFAELRAVTPREVQGALADAFGSLLLQVPPGAQVPQELAAAAPLWSEEVLSGRRLQPNPVHQGGFRELTVSDVGVTAVTQEGNALTVRFADVVAVTPFSDGSRALLARDGVGLTMMAEQWVGFAALTQAVDEKVAADRRLPVQDRTAPQPRGLTKWQKGVRDAVITAGLIVGASILYGVEQVAVIGPLAALVALSVLTWGNVVTHRLPDRTVFIGLASVLTGAALDARILADAGVLLGAIVGGAGLFALLFTVLFIWPRSLGFGTVKAAAIVGAAAGAWGLLPWMAAAGVLGVGFLIAGLLSWRRDVSVSTGVLLLSSLAGAAAAVLPQVLT